MAQKSGLDSINRAQARTKKPIFIHMLHHASADVEDVRVAADTDVADGAMVPLVDV